MIKHVAPALAALALAAPALMPASAMAGPIVGAVAQETKRSGWPHRVTPAEKVAITLHALGVWTPRVALGTARCAWPTGRVNPSICTGSYNLGAYRITWKARGRFYEDGASRWALVWHRKARR